MMYPKVKQAPNKVGKKAFVEDEKVSKVKDSGSSNEKTKKAATEKGSRKEEKDEVCNKVDGESSEKRNKLSLKKKAKNAGEEK